VADVDHTDASERTAPAGFRCLACGGSARTLVYGGCRDHYLGAPLVVDYHRCDGCGLLQQWPLPTDLASLYEDYPIHARKSIAYRLTQRIVMRPSYYDAGAGAHAPGNVILDFGCGDGGFLDTLQGRGFELVGYETDPDHARRVSEHLSLPVLADLDELVSRYEGRVDVVTMHFVLEHVADLASTFDTVHRLLRPGGTFYYVVPDPWSREGRLFKRAWHSLDPPRHLSFPTGPVAQLLADRHGFMLERTVSVPFPNGVAGSLPVVLTGRFRFPVFLLAMPIGVVWSRLAPSGMRGSFLRRR
jgi:SAM-dependent methyltransferase